MTNSPPFHGLNPTAEIYWNEFAGRFPIETLAIKQVKSLSLPAEYVIKHFFLKKKKRKRRQIRSYKKYIYRRKEE